MEKKAARTLVWLTLAAGGTVAWLLSRKKLKQLLKEKTKDWTASFISRQSGLSKDLTRPAANLMLG